MPAATPAPQRLFFAFTAPPAAAALTLESLQATPIVPGVSLIEEGPARGHSYYDEKNGQMVPMWVDAQTLSTVLAAAATYSGGLRVNAGHFTDIKEAAGCLSALRIDGAKLRGDLQLFRTYSGFEHLCELIVTIPDTFGLSIDFEGMPEVRDGKAFARCAEIFSCDLVPTPAANTGGLFARDLPPAVLAQLRRLFDSAPQPNSPAMPEPTTPPPANPPTPPPATPPPAEPPAPSAEAINAAVAAALPAALDAALKPAVDAAVTAATTPLLQRISTLEAAVQADAADDAAVDASPMPAAMKRMRKELSALRAQFGDQGTKLARRFGLEFAARAGANPVDNLADSSASGDETRKPFEIPTSEHNAKVLSALNLRK